MRTYVVLTRQELALEEAADALLSSAAKDPDRPVYSERAFRRREPRLRVSVDRLAHLECIRGQPLRDEMRFLASVTRLTRMERACFVEWVDGWSQREIAERLGVPQQTVCRVLQRALNRCYDSTPLSFDAFSKRTIYRPPSHSLPPDNRRVCSVCGEVLPRRGRHRAHPCDTRL